LSPRQVIDDVERLAKRRAGRAEEAREHLRVVGRSGDGTFVQATTNCPEGSAATTGLAAVDRALDDGEGVPQRRPVGS
jgi:hypothetical protein